MDAYMPEDNKGYPEKDANQTFTWLATDEAKQKGWVEVTGEKAQQFANMGFLEKKLKTGVFFKTFM
jgi:hypothetical protein